MCAGYTYMYGALTSCLRKAQPYGILLALIARLKMKTSKELMQNKVVVKKRSTGDEKFTNMKM